MILYYSTYIIFLAIGISISIYMAARLWTIRKTPGAISLIWAIFCVAVWSFAYIFEIAVENAAIKLAWAKVEYLGIPFISLAIFTFALTYTGRGQWLRGGRLAPLLLIPVTSFLLAATDEWHHLLWSTIQMPDPAMGPLVLGHGVWYNVNIAYSYILLALATYFLILLAVKSASLYRIQVIIMLIGLSVPWIGNLLFVFHLNPLPTIDWTPLAFIFALISFEIGFARFGLMDILPIAESSAFKAMKDGILITDGRNRIVDVNPSIGIIFQQQVDRIIAQPVETLLPDWETWKRETSTAFEVNQELAFGEGMKRRIYSVRIAPIINRRGQTSGHMAILTDVTDQKNAQAQMLLQSTALDAAVNGIVITDTKGRIQWTNQAFTRLTGYAREEAIGRNPRILKSDHQSEAFYKALWETITSGKVWQGELVNRRKDGSEYYEEMTITPLLQPDGAITNFIAIKQDISIRRQAEEQLRQAHDEALQANRLKTQLLANVSHDLRTPLGAIMGYSEMLQSGVFGKITPEQKDAASEILDSANLLLAFVNNLIGQAQIETGRLVLRPVIFKLEELTSGVQTVVSYMAKKKGLEFLIEVAPEMPGQLYADLYWLKQILLNLVNNALKFTDHGSVSVRLALADSDHWCIQVKDTGPGIPAEARQIIFESFRQVEGGGRGGSGLGLAIVNQLTNLMDGKVELESELGQGSVFTVTLPLLIP